MFRSKCWKPLRIIFSVLFAVSFAFAEGFEELQSIVLTGNLNGRTSLDFRKNARNVKYLVPEGTEGTVVETRKLSRTGSYGIKIRITRVGDSKAKNLPKEGEETWVYFSQKDPWLALKDVEGEDIQDPELALTSRAIKDGEGMPTPEGAVAAPRLPSKEEILREQKPERPVPKPSLDPNLEKADEPASKTEADICIDCNHVTSSPRPPQRNVEAIRAVQEKIQNIPDIPDKKWAQFPGVVKYSTSSEVDKTIKYGMRNKETRSKRLCYRYVKRSLLGGDLVDDYLPGAQAKNAVGDLKRRGFINMMDDPRYKDLIKNPKDAPKGAVLVYRNTRDAKHAGHVEIKTDWGSSGGYVSDFYRPTNHTLSNRQLIGVMIKEK
ncbi:hypothetical protein BDW_03685 [Bdellovibrio bacteriovorus W]|nr:hypothetical protein BDW_03685 [Bdellovibrio bacteriovorus W]